MDYKRIIHECEENKHLISMVPAERVVELGWQIGLNKETSVLDLCCGYGGMLKLWSEAFGINGTGIDRDNNFIEEGRSRIACGNITLKTGDIFETDSAVKYDAVVCTELSGGSPGHRLFDSFSEGIAFLERYVKPKGNLIFGRLFSKLPDPPQELIDFDGELPTLHQLNEEIKSLGYHFIAMVSDTEAQWERYIMSGAKNAIERLRASPDDKNFADWDEKWYRIYFEHRRRYEGWGLFAIEKI